MGFFSRFLAPRQDITPTAGFQVLTFAPAVVRISVAGKDATKELDALAAAVAILGFPQGFSNERVFASTTEMVRLIRIEGIDGVTERAKTALSAEEKADAMRLALVSVMMSPLRDPRDTAILSGVAAQLGLSTAEFDALHEASRAFS